MVSGGSIVLAGERKGSSSHSGEWRDSGVLSGAMARAVSCTWAVLRRLGQRENTETVAKLPQPAQPRLQAILDFSPDIISFQHVFHLGVGRSQVEWKLKAKTQISWAK